MLSCKLYTDYEFNLITVGELKNDSMSVLFVFIIYSVVIALEEYRSVTTMTTTNFVILGKMICTGREAGLVSDNGILLHLLYRHGCPRGDNVGKSTILSQAPTSDFNNTTSSISPSLANLP